MIKTWRQRCEEHPDHNGIVSEAMIQARMQEEIDELRAAIEQTEPLHEANEAFGKRQEWWNNRMFEMESELQRYKKSAAMWQGLTDEELDVMRQESKLDFVTLREFRVVAKAVEEKLKERNG